MEIRARIRIYTDAVSHHCCYSENVSGANRDNITSLYSKGDYGMTTHEAQNKAIVRSFFEAFSANDQASMLEVLAADLTAYTHGLPNPQNRDAMVQSIKSWNAAFQTHFTIEEQIAEGDKVATSMTMRAIHNGGEYMGFPPTGRQAEVRGISIERIKDGKIVERQVSSDWHGMMQQLGLIPSPQTAK
jgi:predicted ester cyclase